MGLSRSLSGALAARNPLAAKRVIAVAIESQSVERGQAPVSQTDSGGATISDTRLTTPAAWFSSRIPGVCSVDIGPNNGLYASAWPQFIDDMFDFGYHAKIVNTAIGTKSLATHSNGLISARANSTGYRQNRAPSGGQDRGCTGDIIVANGNVFECTTGNNTYLFHSGAQKIPGSTDAGAIDYVRNVGSLATASSAPDFTAATAVGNTVTDGGIVWTLRALGTTWDGYGTFGGAGLAAASWGGHGFDPFGVLRRIDEEMGRIKDAYRKFIYISGGQSDLTLGATSWGTAVQNIGKWYLDRGYEIVIGLSTKQTSATDTQMQALQTGNTTAYNNLSGVAAYAGRVWRGQTSTRRWARASRSKATTSIPPPRSTRRSAACTPMPSRRSCRSFSDAGAADVPAYCRGFAVRMLRCASRRAATSPIAAPTVLATQLSTPASRPGIQIWQISKSAAAPEKPASCVRVGRPKRHRRVAPATSA